jgi:hypothetical protein
LSVEFVSSRKIVAGLHSNSKHASLVLSSRPAVLKANFASNDNKYVCAPSTKSHRHHQSPGDGHDSSLAGHDSSLAGHDSSLAGHDSSLAGHDSSLAGHDSSLAGHDSSLID